MKTLKLTLASLCVLALITPTSAFGADPDKKAMKPADVLAKFDKNTNGKLDDDEKEALKKAFASDRSMKRLDSNKDGKLDDEEIAALTATRKKKKKQ